MHEDNKIEFNHLKIHTQYSICEGAIKIDELGKYCKENKVKAIGMLDHLQFGNPNDPEIFWTFLESLKGLTDFAKDFEIPCVGGKVSLYNETSDGPIKPTPVIGVIGLIDKKPLRTQKIKVCSSFL